MCINTHVFIRVQLPPLAKNGAAETFPGTAADGPARG